MLVIAACAPHFDRAAHTGRDGEPWGARVVRIGPDGTATVRGVVTARGGDDVDWLAIDVPRYLDCDTQELDVSMKWKGPRGRSKLALTLYDETRTHPTQARRRREHAELRLASTRAGHYFARISAPGRDDAGTYVLRVQQTLGMNCELPTDPYVTVVRPASYRRPALASRLDRAFTDVDTIELDAAGTRGEALLAPVSNVTAGARGTFVDEHGAPIAHGTFAVIDARADATIVRLDEPDAILTALRQGASPWTAAIDLPRPPVEAALVSLRATDDGALLVRFDRVSAPP